MKEFYLFYISPIAKNGLQTAAKFVMKLSRILNFGCHMASESGDPILWLRVAATNLWAEFAVWSSSGPYSVVQGRLA